MWTSGRAAAVRIIHRARTVLRPGPAAVTIAGFAGMHVGIGMLFGLGWSLLVGGAILFVCGGLAEVKAARSPHR